MMRRTPPYHLVSRAFVARSTGALALGAALPEFFSQAQPATPPAHQAMGTRIREVTAGSALAGIDVGESYGSPDGCALYSAFYNELTRKRGFAPKAVLLGRSRGGLMTLSWAADNADKVAGFAGIYPVCNLASYPGLAKAGGAYHLTTETLATGLTEFNPIDRLAALAKARVPFFAIHGDVDKVVPLETNSGEVKKRYEAPGGSMQLVVPPGQGHNMWTGFFQSREQVDFVITAAKRTNPIP